MKNLLLLLAVLISSSSIAQTFVKMDLPASMRSKLTTKVGSETVIKNVTFKTKDGSAVHRGQIRVVVPDSGEGLVSLEFTENILKVGNFTTDHFVVNSTEVNDEIKINQHSACIKWCNDNFTTADGRKLPGRGSCKAGCWIDTTIRVMEAIAVFISPL